MTSFTCLPDLIDETAKTRPADPALICGDIQLSWGGLRARMDYWAELVTETVQGDALNQGVALLTPNCADGVCAFLGILKAGAYAVVLPHHASAEVLHAAFSCEDQKSLSPAQ